MKEKIKYKNMAKREEKEIDDFTPTARIYSSAELQDFHNKIQRFWDTPRTLDDGTIAQKFRHQDLHVAFGAAIKVKHSPGFVYQYNDRMKDFTNLWNQYEEWRKKQDWIEEKRIEELQAIADEVAF